MAKKQRAAVGDGKQLDEVRQTRKKNEQEVEEFLAWRRADRRGFSIPQGVSAAEKLEAFDQLAERDGIGPIDDPSTMVAPFWPKDEKADEIIAAIRELRRKGL